MTLKPRNKTNIFDVAREAGTSTGTVSRVFNNKPDVSAETRARVMRAAKKLGFVPMLTANRVSLGLVMQDFQLIHQVGYIGNVICELTREAAKHGAILEMIHLDNLDAIYKSHCQGLIALLFGRAAARLRAVHHIPVFLINNQMEGDRFYSVTSDHEQGAYLGIRHLLNQGHRRIAFLGIDSNDWGTVEREKGYRKAFGEARVKMADRMVAYLGSSSVEETLDPILQQKLTALFVCGEDLSLAVTDVLKRHFNLDVPRDLSLVTYEIPLVSQLLTPPQTTVAQPWKQIAKAVVTGLLTEIRGIRTETKNLVLPNELIERESVLARRKA